MVKDTPNTDKLIKEQSLLLVAGCTEPTRFKTEGQEYLMTTVLASDESKTKNQISTFQKLLQHLLDKSFNANVLSLQITQLVTQEVRSMIP